MKTFFLSLIFQLLAVFFVHAQERKSANYTLPKTDTHYRNVKDYVEDVPDPSYSHPSEATIEAFRDIKFGVRIHWGLYSITEQGNESWPYLKLSNEGKQAYQDLYKTWNPEGFDAEEWMKLFSENGIRMFAFTSMHHEGFSMFDTRARVKKRVNWTAPGGPVLEDCDLAYSIMETPFKRDVVKELCDAAHKYGVKIDLYFSHPNWYNADFRPYNYHPCQTPDAKIHPDLYGNAVREPYIIVPDVAPEEEARMMANHRLQLTELLTKYGKIDMICLDQWLGKKVWPQMRREIIDLRKIQPEVMFRARGIGNYGDYYTPEGFIPGNPENTDMPWFVIYPYGKSFSYVRNDEFKGTGWIIKSLIDIVAKGGNFMMGIGPDGNGKFDPRVVQAIKEAGYWLKINGEAIYSTRPREGDLWKEGDAIRFTRTKDNKTVYAITREWPGNELIVKTVKPEKGSDIKMLGYDKPLKWRYYQKKGLTITIPESLQDSVNRASNLGWCFKIQI